MAKTTGLAGIPAWGLSLMTFFGSFLLALFLNDESASQTPGYSPMELLAPVLFVIVIAGASFLICRTHPRSVWYTPLICNGFGIIAIILAIFTRHKFTTAEPWILWGSSLLLSIVGAIVGSRVGQRTNKQAK